MKNQIICFVLGALLSIGITAFASSTRARPTAGKWHRIDINKIHQESMGPGGYNAKLNTELFNTKLGEALNSAAPNPDAVIEMSESGSVWVHDRG